MNSGWAASAGEAAGSDCGESAGHMGTFLASYEPVTIEGHNVPSGVVRHRVEEVIGSTTARTSMYPSETGDQMPDGKPESS